MERDRCSGISKLRRVGKRSATHRKLFWHGGLRCDYPPYEDYPKSEETRNLARRDPSSTMEKGTRSTSRFPSAHEGTGPGCLGGLTRIDRTRGHRPDKAAAEIL